ncbi:hypothetical protein TNCV_1150781 [Trichonephila clavipes]|nr:hypothetical protein TNCV_1150781 [Trichonephila clavipes]
MNIVTMLSQEDIPVSSLWDLEMLGIRDTTEQNSREKGKGGYVSLSRNSPAKGRWQIRGPYALESGSGLSNRQLWVVLKKT